MEGFENQIHDQLVLIHHCLGAVQCSEHLTCVLVLMLL